MLREHRRLLYVALTRARDRLYVCGFENRQGVKAESWYALARQAAEALGRPITRHGEAAHAVGHVGHEKRHTELEPVADTTPSPGWLWPPGSA